MAACWLLIFCSAGLAADNAERGFALFSPDGRYFAFEQFGVQDGSGFPFSDIHIVDLERDEWVDGTPVRVRLEDEGAMLSAARASAAAKAAPIMTRLKITDPGELLAANMATEVVADRRNVSFARFFPIQGWAEEQNPAQPTQYTLTVEIVPFPLKQPCWDDDTTQYGFALRVRNKETGAETEVYRDTSVPSSRFCPRTYDIGEIIVFREALGKEHHVALIAMYSPGFEGMNRDLLAVPLKLP